MDIDQVKNDTLTINSDIIYNIMYQSGLSAIISLSEINKMFYYIHNDKYFWKNKLTKDYFIIQNDQNINWKTEYIIIHDSVITITKLMEFFHLLNTERFIYLYDGYNIIDIRTIHWLPTKLKEKIGEQDITSIYSYFYTEGKINGYTLVINYKGQNEYIKDSITINKEELINFLILSLYYYPNLYLKDAVDGPFLYKDLINKKVSPRDKHLQHRLECWDQINKK